ncbi:hypothetical protein VB005_08655 [Metarhizium brunneum]
MASFPGNYCLHMNRCARGSGLDLRLVGRVPWSQGLPILFSEYGPAIHEARELNSISMQAQDPHGKKGSW